MRIFRILFLCTGNAARSVMAAALLGAKLSQESIQNLDGGNLEVVNLVGLSGEGETKVVSGASEVSGEGEAGQVSKVSEAKVVSGVGEAGEAGRVSGEGEAGQVSKVSEVSEASRASKASEQRIVRIEISSAGMLVTEGLPTSPRVEKALNQYGLSARQHRGRQVRAEDVTSADLIVCFESLHIDYVKRNFPDDVGKAITLPQLCKSGFRFRDLVGGADDVLVDKSGAGSNADISGDFEVSDPDKGGDQEMKQCADEISELLDKIL